MSRSRDFASWNKTHHRLDRVGKKHGLDFSNTFGSELRHFCTSTTVPWRERRHINKTHPTKPVRRQALAEVTTRSTLKDSSHFPAVDRCSSKPPTFPTKAKTKQKQWTQLWILFPSVFFRLLSSSPMSFFAWKCVNGAAPQKNQSATDTRTRSRKPLPLSFSKSTRRIFTSLYSFSHSRSCPRSSILASLKSTPNSMYMHILLIPSSHSPPSFLCV